MTYLVFDEHAAQYDAWFMKNLNILTSEVLLVRAILGQPGRTLSVGCGSGLFEDLLRRHHGIDIREGAEPSEAMAAIARKRGMTVIPGTAEQLPCPDAVYDTVLLNGSPSYIDDLPAAFREAHRVLRPSGHVVVVDVPAESSYALLYNLAAALGSWDHPILRAVKPATPYPVELAAAAHWRTTREKVAMLEAAGFREFEFMQTLTCHPLHSDDAVEEPSQGFDRGDYVAIRARKL
jgi:ubiquinone/menaquinone biosynthesis C-methylase UbiE